jgi:hypothetical protein
MSYGGSLSSWKQQLRVSQLAAMVRDRWQRPPRPCSVYLLRVGELCKIGMSFNAELRIKHLQLPQAPDEAKVFRLASCDQARILEAELHQQYAAKREYGEWFRLTGDDLNEIAKRCAERVVA